MKAKVLLAEYMGIVSSSLPLITKKALFSYRGRRLCAKINIASRSLLSRIHLR